MGNIDVEVQYVIWKYAMPIFVVLLLLRLCKRQIKTLYYMGYAYVLNKIGVSYSKRMSKHKETLFQELQTMTEDLGRALCILEIGCGSGTNFRFFPTGTNVICLDPNPHFSKYLLSNKDNYPNVNFKEFVVGKAEDLSLIPNNSVDAVVCTIVMCSVDEVDLCLSEIKRVLRKVSTVYVSNHLKRG